MKSSDIILQLRSTLPGLTNYFSTDVPLVSLVNAGTTVTAVTSAPHNLLANYYVYIANAQRQTAIASITRVGTIATVVTSVDHDLTEVWFPTVDMVSSTTTEFNGTFKLLSVPNRRTYTIQVPNSGATAGTGPGQLLEPWRPGFGGFVKVVSVISPTSFTYTAGDSFNSAAYGPTMTTRTLPRITGSASLERAQASYTKDGANNYWAFVVMGPVRASKSMHTMTDPVSSHTNGSMYRQFLINSIYVYVFVPMSASLSGRAERDSMADVTKYLFKSLLGKSYPSYFVDQPVNTLNFKQHRQSQYIDAYYIHEFEFESISEVTTNDIVDPDPTRAFRDLSMSQRDVFNIEEMLTQINIDDVPL